MSQMVASEFENTYQRYDGKWVYALIIGTHEAEHIQGTLEVLDSNWLRIGTRRIQAWAVLTLENTI